MKDGIDSLLSSISVFSTPVPSRCRKSSFQVALQKNCFQLPLTQNLRSWIKAYYKLSKAEQLLACFSSTCSWQCINLQQTRTSSSYSHCRMKSLKVKADLCLDKVRFLCMADSGTGTNLLFAVNTSGMGKEGRKAQASPWRFYFQHLAMMATQRTGQLCPKCFIK